VARYGPDNKPLSFDPANSSRYIGIIEAAAPRTGGEAGSPVCPRQSQAEDDEADRAAVYTRSNGPEKPEFAFMSDL
jgi:hypothetical protein